MCNTNRGIFNNGAPEEIIAVKPVREKSGNSVACHRYSKKRLHSSNGRMSFQGWRRCGWHFLAVNISSPVVGTWPTLWIDLSISAASLRSLQIAFIRELRAALLCSFHFSIPLWSPHRDVNQSALPSFQNNSKVRLLVTGPNLNNLSYSRHLTRPAFLLSLFLFFFLRSLASPVTPESAVRKMETSASVWMRRKAEWISPPLLQNAHLREPLSMLPRITAVACPVRRDFIAGRYSRTYSISRCRIER